MYHSIVLYCTLLHSTVVYGIVLYCSILYGAAALLHCTALEILYGTVYYTQRLRAGLTDTDAQQQHESKKSKFVIRGRVSS